MDPASPVRITNEMTQPELISRVEPEYPGIAFRAGISGEVILECIIDERGDVSISKVLKPVAMLEKATEDAVTQWKYKPAMWNGRPQAVFLVIRVKFSLPLPEKSDRPRSLPARRLQGRP